MIECDFFGKAARFHHVGLGVRSIEALAPAADCAPIMNNAEGVSLAFIDLNGVRIELLEPIGENSPIAASVRSGKKLLHLCYEVEDLESAAESYRLAGFHRLGPARQEPIFDGRKVVWVFSRHLGLFELIERANKHTT